MIEQTPFTSDDLNNFKKLVLQVLGNSVFTSSSFDANSWDDFVAIISLPRRCDVSSYELRQIRKMSSVNVRHVLATNSLEGDTLVFYADDAFDAEQ